MHSGRVLLEDKIGNAKADTLAVAGSDMHAAVIVLERDSQARLDTFREYQRSLLNILKERERALGELPEHVTGPPLGQTLRRASRRSMRL